MQVGNRQIEIPRLWTLRVLRWAVCALLVLIVLPTGSVASTVLHIVAIGFFGVAALAAIFGELNERTQAPYRLALAAALFVAVWILAQSCAFTGNPLANWVWNNIAAGHGAVASSISVAPGDSLEGLVAACLPFAVFLTVLVLFPSDAAALGLVRFLVVSGALICAVGLLQFSFFPNELLFSPKRFYLESLTTVFVNRNTAATYIAMTVVFSAGLAYHHLQDGGAAGLFRYLLKDATPLRQGDARRGIGYGAMFVLALICLMLTQSRAGIGAALFGLLLMAAILSILGNGSARRGGAGSGSLWSRLVRVFVALVAVIGIGLLFAGPAIFRAGAQGATDLRFCFFPSLMRMAGDNWLLGTGFGTFRDVFPAYRNPACGMDGVLVMAHNFYLEGVISLGLPFVVVAVFAVTALVWLLVGGVRDRRRFRWLPAAGLGALTLQLIHNSVDFSIQNPAIAAVFAAYTAAAVVIARARLPGRARPATARGDRLREHFSGAVQTQGQAQLGESRNC
jgi:hypothetical protein